MRVLVTGSSGQLGAAIATELSRSHEVVGLDLVAGPATSQHGDITNSQLISRLCDGADAIVHAASLHAAHLHTHSPAQFEETNVAGTRSLLDAAVRHNIRRFIYTSTTSVYGHAMEDQGRAVWVTEELVPQPRDIYDTTKLAAEELCSHVATRHGITCLCLRISRFFPEPARLMAIYRTHRGIDVRDSVTAHVLAMTAPIDGFEVFNISGLSPFKETDLIDLKSRAPDVLRRYYPDIDADFSRRAWAMPQSIDRVYVIEKACRRLGFSPRFGLGEYLNSLGA
ncbi:MAG: NAD-dependent epimerase/dehydratase family protein [Tepidisphaeraceae bacterium]